MTASIAFTGTFRYDAVHDDGHGDDAGRTAARP